MRPASNHIETPRAVIVRIFGATGLLLAALLVVLHPDAVTAAMHAMMAAAH